MNYALHPGFINSIKDGQEHYIDFGALINLYKLDGRNCALWDDKSEQTYRGKRKEDYIHLYPLIYGNYDEVKTLEENKRIK